MNAKLDLTDVQYTTMDYGFYWGTSEESQTTYVKGGEIAENAYFVSLTGLSHKTQYWYKAYLKVDNQEFYGEEKTFTTDVVPVESVSLDKTACTVHTIDSTFTLTPTVLPEDATNKSVTWESSNTSVATVDTDGKVTAKGNGSATITVTTDDQSKTATCEITVAQWVTGITLDKTTLALNEGQTEVVSIMSVTPDDANDKSVIWSSNNTSVATVDQSGRVTAVSKGTATITTKANDGSGLSVSCSVTVNRLISSIDFDKTSIALYNGESTAITTTILPESASNKNLSWSSSNTSVATVSTSGEVTGVSRGTAIITATTNDGSGISKNCEVEVKQYLTDITLNMYSVTLIEGQTTIILVKSVTPDDANDKSVTWLSDNTSVATVDQNGQVTAVLMGAATITVKANDGSGKSASCSVTVAQNLSVNGCANCYIVSSAGNYCFRTTQGNSSTVMGNVSNAKVLWESYGTSTILSTGSLVKNIRYRDNSIYFSTPDPLKNGNAVIAARDARGNILWSWHIWVCKDFNPIATAQEYYNNAGTMMDRNLGAISATPGDVGALGLLYQWGRKDPFLGSNSISFNHSIAASTLSNWPLGVSSDSSCGTIEYAVKHPTVFIVSNPNNNDWYYSTSSSTDNTRWQSSKTIYDPCPPGWRVPDGGGSGVWSESIESSSYFNDCLYDDINKGINFSGKFGSASTIWYPAAGLRPMDASIPTKVGSFGYWWSCTPDDLGAYSLYLYYDGFVYPSMWYSNRACGFSVRCQKE
ncbi:MAG: Ig-like domain-containing protein [Bacteroidales bacterium]|nr:Ig-like domain-containing protein [Bacteroidales bacterium]